MRLRFDGCAVLSSLVDVSEADERRLRDFAIRRGVRIFNPDEKRIQRRLPAADPFFQKIRAAFERAGLLRGREMHEASVLHSFAGCAEQRMHYDYDCDCGVAAARVMPLGAIVGLRSNTRLCVAADDGTRKYVEFGRGDVLVFAGSVLHAGAAYRDRDNTRVHVYLDSPSVPRTRDTTFFPA